MNIVLSGSSTGIGRAVALRLLERGHRVWGLARSSQVDLEVRYNGAFRATRCDVSGWTQVAAAAEEAGNAWNHFDAIVACAGIQGEIGRTLDADPAGWIATVRANLEGTFNVIRAFDPLLRRSSQRAKIVCFSGGGASQARPNFSAYGVAKTGVVRLVETIAAEESSRALDINAVAPGAIHTRMTEEIISRGAAIVGEKEYASALKGREISEAHLAKALGLVEWLLSSASDGVTGRFLSAQWDDWASLGRQRSALQHPDLYTLRRITPDRR